MLATINSGRNDSHAPSVMNPADYTEVGYFDNHPEEGGSWMDPAYSDKEWFNGNYTLKSRCDHCGAGPLRYGVVFYHAPSDLTVVVGERCAGKLGLSSRSELERRRIIAQVALARKSDEFRAAHPAVAEFLQGARQNGDRSEFVTDIARKQLRYGGLSEKQIAAIEKTMADRAAKQAERDAEPKPEQPLAEGRYVIEGEVVSTKVVDGDFGTSYKILIALDDGNRVYGTAPEYLVESNMGEEGWSGAFLALKGLRVRLTGTVERSPKDENFGFYKRPTKSEVVR